MATFKYKALSPDGTEMKGVMQAPDEYSAVQRIRQKCPVIQEITQVKESGDSKNLLSLEIGSKKIDEKALSVMCSQFAIMLRSGQMIGRVMQMVADQTADKKLKKLLQDCAEDVEEGSSVASALERHGDKMLPMTFIETVRAGEMAGTLETSFTKLESYYEKSYKNKQKVKSVMSYPIFVMVVAVIVLIVIMAKVVPSLAATFADLGGELPLITQILINTSKFFQRWYILMIIVIIALVIGSKIYFGTEKGRLVKGRLMLTLPVLGKINIFSGAAQFADTMSTMLSSGLTVNHAVEVTGKVLDNALLSEQVGAMIPKIEEGRGLGECMKACEFFPDNLKEMVAVGEESGSLDETLTTIADYYYNEQDHATQQAVSKLEPTIMIFLALFAGFIVLAIYLPMFTMYNLM